MNNLHTLFDAFDGLEQRADAAFDTTAEHALASPTGRRTTRLLAPAAAAAAVITAAAVVAVWQNSSGSQQPAAGSGPAAGSVTAASAAPVGKPSAPARHSTAPGAYDPPATAAQLTARARAILAGTATIEVTGSDSGAGAPARVLPASSAPARGHGDVSGPALPSGPVGVEPGAGSGAAIRGALTADGLTGGFDLNVYATTAPFKAMCDADTHCSVRRLADGTSLAVGNWHDSQVPGGVTYQVDAVRPDGADVLLHLSTERDPKGQSNVTATRMPLSVQQMIDFVTSDRW